MILICIYLLVNSFTQIVDYSIKKGSKNKETSD